MKFTGNQKNLYILALILFFVSIVLVCVWTFTGNSREASSGAYPTPAAQPTAMPEAQVTAVPDLQNNEIVFIAYGTIHGLEVNDATELMRIRIVDKNDAEALSSTASMKILAETDECLYLYSETMGYKTGKLALTESELSSTFIIF